MLVAIVLAAGCYRGSTYETDMPAPPAFPLELEQAASAAAADWQQHVPVSLAPIVRPCPNEPRPLATLCLLPVEKIPAVPWEPGTLSGFTIGNDVWLAVPPLLADPPDRRQRLIAHELGHAMGLVHDSKGTLMFPWANGGSLVVTDRDVAQWHRVHD